MEPWLRGPIPDVDPLIAPVLYSFEQAYQDLEKYTEGLSVEQIWATPHGFGAVGFHMRHIAGSVERLMTYVQGRSLSNAQLGDIERQHEPGATRGQLLAGLRASFQNASTVVKGLNPARLTENREVGRQRLPTTVIGLLTHIAEHTQRHVGQAISAAKLARVS